MARDRVSPHHVIPVGTRHAVPKNTVKPDTHVRNIRPRGTLPLRDIDLTCVLLKVVALDTDPYIIAGYSLPQSSVRSCLSISRI
jgi:hypothetical protein